MATNTQSPLRFYGSIVDTSEWPYGPWMPTLPLKVRWARQWFQPVGDHSTSLHNCTSLSSNAAKHHTKVAQALSAHVCWVLRGASAKQLLSIMSSSISQPSIRLSLGQWQEPRLCPVPSVGRRRLRCHRPRRLRRSRCWCRCRRRGCRRPGPLPCRRSLEDRRCGGDLHLHQILRNTAHEETHRPSHGQHQPHRDEEAPALVAVLRDLKTNKTLAGRVRVSKWGWSMVMGP